MHILMIPYSENNPYQQQLVDNLPPEVMVSKSSQSAAKLAQNIMENGFIDVIHLHWIYPIISGRNSIMIGAKSLLLMIICLFCKLIGIDIIWTVHNIQGHSNNGRFTKKFEKKLYEIMVRHVCDSVIAHCSSAKNKIVEEYDVQDQEEKILIIPHGSYHSYYDNKISKKEAQESISIDDGEFVFLFFGSVQPYKNIPELIQSFKSISASDLRLLVAGKPQSNEYSSILKSHAGDASQITLDLKYIPERDVQKYMNAADVVVLPYDDILTSGSVMLGMAFSKPIIAPRSGCIKDILLEQNNYMYDSIDELTERMSEAVNESHKLNDYGEINRKEVEKYDWNSISARTAAAYNNME